MPGIFPTATVRTAFAGENKLTLTFDDFALLHLIISSRTDRDLTRTFSELAGNDIRSRHLKAGGILVDIEFIGAGRPTAVIYRKIFDFRDFSLLCYVRHHQCKCLR